MIKKVICTVCPVGCNIEVDINENKEILSINGNTCKRGEIYATDECINPKRTLTTTVLTEDKRVVSVKTNVPVKKELLFECMSVINKTVVSLPVKIGDIVIENILDTGSDIVACANME